jgi:hypothetical protein
MLDSALVRRELKRLLGPHGIIRLRFRRKRPPISGNLRSEGPLGQNSLSRSFATSDVWKSGLDGRLGPLAYPNGLPETDYNCENVRVVEEAGYQFAFTTVPRVCKSWQTMAGDASFLGAGGCFNRGTGASLGLPRESGL